MHWDADPIPVSPARHVVSAVAWSLMAALVLAGGSFWAGRRVERASQLGRVLALQQLERDTWAAVRALDSISMRYMVGASRARVKASGRPVGRSGPP